MGPIVYYYRLLHYEKASLLEARARLSGLLSQYGCVMGEAIAGVSRRSLLTLLRSPHVNKKSREQFTTIYYTLTFRVYFEGAVSLLSELETSLRLAVAAEGFLPYLVIQRELQTTLAYRSVAANYSSL
jgi:ribosomal protein S10